MDDLKVALICTEKLTVPPIAGGAVQIYIDGILPYLSKTHDVTVFCIEHPSLPDSETKNGVKYVRLPARTVNEYLKNIKPKLNGFDLVHVFNRPLWVIELGRGLPNTRFSLSLHNEMFHAGKISPSKAAECIERVEFINTVSKFIADGVVKLFPQAKDKMNVVYSGIDIEKYQPNWSEIGAKNKKKLKEKYGIADKKVVLFVGRLSVKKGVHTLLRAIKEVASSIKNVALVVIGSKWFGSNEKNEYTVFLENLAKDINVPIIFTGFLTPDQVPAHYNMGDIFVCPSEWEEPLARVHYEAMGAGLPIITTNRGGNAEVVKGFENGIVIDDYSNPNAFARAIIELLSNPDKADNMGKNGHKYAQEKFNWKRVADDILKAIDNIDMKKSPKIKVIIEKDEVDETFWK